MQTVWVLEGKHAGKFIPLPDEEAQRLISEGKAQPGSTPAHKIQRPTYSTREMVAAEPTSDTHNTALSIPDKAMNSSNKKNKKKGRQK